MSETFWYHLKEDIYYTIELVTGLSLMVKPFAENEHFIKAYKFESNTKLQIPKRMILYVEH